MNEKKVQIVRLNWDEMCRLDLITGKGFEITEPAFKNKEGEKSLNGIQSPRFCTDYEDEDAFAERYSCDCKDIVGKRYKGDVCPKCKSKVEFKDVDLSITGWIRLHKCKLIQPIFYMQLKSVIGDKQLTEIIEFDKETTKDGLLVDKKGKSPFKGIGIREFEERLEEILEYYGRKKKHKAEIIDSILEERDKVFISSIPIYSSVLRPSLFKGDTFFYNTIDKCINPFFSIVQLLNNGCKTTAKKKDKDNVDERTLLYAAQKRLMTLWVTVFELIESKDGHKLFVS